MAVGYAGTSSRVLERASNADPHSNWPVLDVVDDEPLSPELALVDPVAAARARSALPEIVLTETLLEASRRPPSQTQSAPTNELGTRQQRLDERPSYEDIFRIVERLANEAPSHRRRFSRRLAASAVVVGLVSVVAIGALRLFALRPSSEPRAEPTRSTASASSAVEATATRTFPSSTSLPSSRTPARQIPRFVWVRDQRAHGYSVEFRIGSKVVYQTRTRVEQLRVAPSRLRPGNYRWIVWRLDPGGKRIGPPLVDSRLTIG